MKGASTANWNGKDNLFISSDVWKGNALSPDIRRAGILFPQDLSNPKPCTFY